MDVEAKVVEDREVLVEEGVQARVAKEGREVPVDVGARVAKEDREVPVVDHVLCDDDGVHYDLPYISLLIKIYNHFN